MKYFKIKNLKQWQHYKDRRPPWIKLHSSILDDYDFTKLKDKTKAHLMLLWLLASQCDNKLPLDEKWLTNKLGLTDKIDLDELQTLKFIEVYQDASIMLAQSKQSDIVETETETETETNKKHVQRRSNVQRMLDCYSPENISYEITKDFTPPEKLIEWLEKKNYNDYDYEIVLCQLKEKCLGQKLSLSGIVSWFVQYQKNKEVKK